MEKKLSQLNKKQLNIYELDDFSIQTVDQNYLDSLHVSVTPSQDTLSKLIKGSEIFKERYKHKTVIPKPIIELCNIDLESKLEIHNYTGACPTLTYEVNPVVGCNVGCLYCLVTDGIHENRIKAYQNYHVLLEKILEEKRHHEHYFYFSPKTEAFQEPTLQTGIAHNILRTFINHFKEYPQSKARLFIASKAGVNQLLYKYKDESILDLFIQLKDKMQFNTSVSIMPNDFRDILEPFAPSIEERLEAVKLCQDHGIMANSALVQPIVAPYLTDEIIHDFFRKLKKYNIINYKPEFLTLCMENLSMIGQIQGYYDKALEKALYEYYIKPENANHKKQRGRTAPNRDLSIHYLIQLMDISKQYGLSTSICYWVRKQLKISEDMIPIINRNGFQCLGYQTKFFQK